MQPLQGWASPPDKPTVLLTSGKEGVGDYTGAIDSLARRHEGPLKSSRFAEQMTGNERSLECKDIACPTRCR